MNLFSKIAMFLFGLITVLHALRLIFEVAVNIGGYQIPLWMSYGGFFIFLFLFIGMWGELKKKA